MNKLIFRQNNNLLRENKIAGLPSKKTRQTIPYGIFAWFGYALSKRATGFMISSETNLQIYNQFPLRF
jgi:hypothetical protein